MKREPDLSQVAGVLASLGHEARLSVYRVLVRAGSAGVNVKTIADHLDLPPSTLAHHLRALVQAGLVIQERQGRETICKPNFDAVEKVMSFLNKECCEGFED